MLNNIQFCKNNLNSKFLENYFKKLEHLLQDMKIELKLFSFPTTPVVIFDIDNTLILNIDDHRNTLSYNNEIFANKPVIDLYNFILYDLKYKIIIITARNIKYISSTENLLNSIGIINYDKIIMRDNDFINIAFFKLKNRKIISQNYTIVANVGDKETDFLVDIMVL